MKTVRATLTILSYWLMPVWFAASISLYVHAVTTTTWLTFWLAAAFFLTLCVHAVLGMVAWPHGPQHIRWRHVWAGHKARELKREAEAAARAMDRLGARALATKRRLDATSDAIRERGR